jgi:hypothetical protein|tara:strand:- start:771 stop:1064 length:294 start_codon:yes stop_codon:yes gene_type:complete
VTTDDLEQKRAERKRHIGKIKRFRKDLFTILKDLDGSRDPCKCCGIDVWNDPAEGSMKRSVSAMIDKVGNLLGRMEDDYANISIEIADRDSICGREG